MRRPKSTWPIAFAAMMLALCTVARGAELDQPLARMDHVMWTARDGAPQAVNALAQANDGTLWIGADSGLFNFDGRTFTAYESPPGEPAIPKVPVLSVRTARDGALWVGFFQSGVARIAGGRVKVWTKADALHIDYASNLNEAADGSMWAMANNHHLIRIGKDGECHLESVPLTGRIGGIFIDSANTLWVAQGRRLHRRPLSQGAYTDTQIAADVAFGFSEMPGGGIWMTDVDTTTPSGPTGRAQLFDPSGKRVKEMFTGSVPSNIIPLADGSLFFSWQNRGIRRFTPREVESQTVASSEPDQLTAKDGLSSDRIPASLIDADGNIWLGTLRGLDRLKRARLTVFRPEAQVARWSVCAGSQGELWISSTNGEFHHVAPDGRVISFPEVGDAYSLACMPEGKALVLLPTTLVDARPEGITRGPPIPNTRPYQVMQIASGPDGTVYARASGTAENGGGTWRRKEGQWSVLPDEEGMGGTGTVTYVDSQNRLWTGYYRGQVTVRDAAGGQSFSSGDPGLGWILAILETPQGMLAGGTNGVAALRGTNFDVLAFENDVAPRGVRGLVESRNGDLWINESRGIVHVSAAELAKGRAHPAYRMKAERIAEGESAGALQGLNAKFANAARDARGRLWFVTRSHVVHLDPDERGTSRLPVMTIRAISVDGRIVDDGLVEPKPQTLAIQYRGVNLTAPDRITYRYRLEGLEDAWQDPGSRSEAIYTRLPPGTYTFHVMASNGDGAWTAPVASRPFTVLPSFYQTAWFALLCALALLGLLWIFFTMRVRAITRFVRARAEERADERIRIARELHDTLLQGIQGLLLTFHVVAQKMSASDESKPVLERALSTADRLILDGRNRVGSLRSEHVSDAELVAALQNAGNELNAERAVQFAVTRSGGGATLHAHVADEVFFIAREALSNAFHHAQASRITVELAYGRRYFSLVCEDDGRGIRPDEREKAGHWGVQGIEERGRKVGGQVRITGEAGRGTQVTVVVPSYLAYARHSRAMFYLGAWRYSERNPLRRTRNGPPLLD